MDEAATSTARSRTVWDESMEERSPAVPARQPRGDVPEEFEAFFHAHHADVFACFRLIARDRSEAEEIAQEAFLRVWQRWDRVAAMDRPAGYLFRTAMNVFRSRRRRAAMALRRPGRRDDRREAVGRERANGSRGVDPTDGALGGVVDRDTIVRALAGLSERQRAAFVLTEGLGLTSEEAGEAMGISASTVRVQVSRAREALRRRTGERDG